MIVDLFLVYQFIKRIATPFNEWEAYKQGVIDENGNILKRGRDRRTVKERDSFGKYDLMILKLKKLLEKVPGGNTRLGSYAAALWLIKENNEIPTEQRLIEYIHYIKENQDVNNFLSEATDKPPSWKRAGPNGELEIKFPTGRKFMIEKQYDYNDRHKGDWMVNEWIKGDWEWVETYSPKWYAKENVMKMGQYDKKGKKVADYSSTFQYESTIHEEGIVNTAGSGNIHGIGVGPKGEPGVTPDKMKKYKKKNQEDSPKPKRLSFKDML